MGKVTRARPASLAVRLTHAEVYSRRNVRSDSILRLGAKVALDGPQRFCGTVQIVGPTGGAQTETKCSSACQGSQLCVHPGCTMQTGPGFDAKVVVQ